MPPAKTPNHFVVDGSNIATEGRSAPSLAQLNEAVLAFMEDYPGVVVTVVVDATFGHRIDPKEVKAFDEAVANNELVAPPAGAVGRGDAFVLTIANKARAGVLSNDSFQEFHGDYDWLFEEGRLIGGKPVPNVGWVFVPRTPVRGPKSRRSIREANGDAQADKHRATARVRRKATAEELATAEGAPPPLPANGTAGPPPSPAALRERTKAIVASGGPAPTAKGHVNELGPFLEFVERHPVGTTVSAVVDSYSSHGAYARVDDVLVYVPLRLMDEPPPSSARRAMQVGTTHELVIVGFVPDRRSIDAARPHVAAKQLPEGIEVTPLGAAPEAPKRGRRRKGVVGTEPAVAAEPALPGLVAEPAPEPAAEAPEPAAPRAARGRRRKADAVDTVEAAPSPAAEPVPPAGEVAPAAPARRGRSRAHVESTGEAVAGPLPDTAAERAKPARRGRKAVEPASPPASTDVPAPAEPARRGRRGKAEAVPEVSDPVSDPVAAPEAAEAPGRARRMATASAPTAARSGKSAASGRPSRARKAAAEMTEADTVSARARARRRPAAAAEPAGQPDEAPAKPARKVAARTAKSAPKDT